MSQNRGNTIGFSINNCCVTGGEKNHHINRIPYMNKIRIRGYSAMKLMKVLAVLLLAGTLASCGGLTRKDTSRWLDSKNSPSTADMTGEWDSSESLSGGWGRATFYQEGRNFSGSLGRYYAEGVVSGEEIYLVLYSGKTVYYTATLKKKDNDTYMGKAVYEAIADHKDARMAQSYLITLKKLPAK